MQYNSITLIPSETLEKYRIVKLYETLQRKGVLYLTLLHNKDLFFRLLTEQNCH